MSEFFNNFCIRLWTGNGYVRSEAAVVIYIQKKDLAHRNYASILHAKTNTDGYKEQGITFPAGSVQKQLLETIYSEAGIHPAQVSYVEVSLQTSFNLH